MLKSRSYFLAKKWLSLGRLFAFYLNLLNSFASFSKSSNSYWLFLFVTVSKLWSAIYFEFKIPNLRSNWSGPYSFTSEFLSIFTRFFLNSFPFLFLISTQLLKILMSFWSLRTSIVENSTPNPDSFTISGESFVFSALLLSALKCSVIFYDISWKLEVPKYFTSLIGEKFGVDEREFVPLFIFGWTLLTFSCLWI